MHKMQACNLQPTACICYTFCRSTIPLSIALAAFVSPPRICTHTLLQSKTGCLDCHQLNALQSSGQLALSVAEGNSEGAQATGKTDAWSFPNGHPLARKASSVEPSIAEPLFKKRKLSGSAAAAEKITLATGSPVESCAAAAAAASKPDGPSAYGEALQLCTCRFHAVMLQCCTFCCPVFTQSERAAVCVAAMSLHVQYVL